MLLDTEELIDLEDKLKDELNLNLTSILTTLNRTNQLESFLNMINLGNLLDNEDSYPHYKDGKILVIGISDIDEETIKIIGKSYGISKDRFKCFLKPNDTKNTDFSFARWNYNYSLIMVGPIAHSGVTKGNHSSVITALEQDDGYPPVVRLEASNKLKITKSNFKNKLEEVINSGLIE